MKEVTVLIPCYNQVRYVNKAIDSAIYQGAKVIVYDDASTDGTTELLKNRGDVKVIYGTENSGTAAKPMNVMMYECDTEYFIPLSADDMLAPGAVRTLLENVNGYDWLYPNTYLMDEEGIIFDGWNYENFPRDFDGMREYVRINFSSPAPWMGIFRTSFVKDNELKMIGFESVNNGEDMRTILDWITYQPKIGWIPAYLYYYRRHPGARTYGIMGHENLDYKREVMKLLGVNDD